MTATPDQVDALLRAYIGRRLLAREAHLEDPLYHAQLEWLRQMLTVLRQAMDSEQVPPHVRDRVVHRVLYGSKQTVRSSMVRRETYCDGRLVKEIDQVNVGGVATNFHNHYVDGHHAWLLDGTEITEAQAETFRAARVSTKTTGSV
ncbi:hypothetical protein OG352_05280 [Streptomyces sp. NBC_01485]|uniref:hypothetical protein n=1 Tax=Streptomyces sp. NBC_01485 TaxID=2903884 RepID=UPI002E305835|nr:hypothetical protein [Streptomyces sp. NBC_01485]